MIILFILDYTLLVTISYKHTCYGRETLHYRTRETSLGPHDENYNSGVSR